MALTPAEQAAYRKLWNFIQPSAIARAASGAYQYASSAIISAASAVAREYGQALSFLEAQGIPGLISLARSQDRAIGSLNSAAPGQAIDASMIATWPTAASLAVQAAQPEYFARAQYTYTNAVGMQDTAWIQLRGITQLPSSADSLALALTGAAISARNEVQPGTPGLLDAEKMASFGEIIPGTMQLWAM